VTATNRQFVHANAVFRGPRVTATAGPKLPPYPRLDSITRRSSPLSKIAFYTLRAYLLTLTHVYSSIFLQQLSLK